MMKKGLGRGLDALIRTPASVPVKAAAGAESAVDPGTGEAVRRVALDQVGPSPFQPRKRFNEEHLGELVESIREHGVIQPLIVRRVKGKFELIAGERRWRACQKLKLDEVPVIVREASDKDVLEMALIENLQREDLNPLEEAEAYARLARDFGLKQEEIAKRVGKNRATVANAIRLLDLDPAVQNLVAQQILSPGHGKAILGIKGRQEQKMVADIVVKKKLNVRDTEKLVSETLNGRTTTKKPPVSKLPKQVENYVRNIEDRLRGRFATNVTVNHGEKKGKIEIEYFGNDDLSRLLQLLGLPEE
ncbi:MAG: ParB/RepB/Spo0J family partition protein [Verrucomicrobiae bacterium]|nr:ParB/RepB/Spo0J family partition protein [Verrucomicrobiae bacterium]MCP5541150.1 ParB/RepB/Spo0J family partition protein [Akkermansiaceae bacterium]MCP5551271.1 ParB/RepB/Spo0J family partition protein [Akkermansiaceae bacterium]